MKPDEGDGLPPHVKVDPEEIVPGVPVDPKDDSYPSVSGCAQSTTTSWSRRDGMKDEIEERE
jgi:hypothetical protein